MTDEILMSAYKEGQEAAFIKLYEKFSPLVYGYARKRLRPSDVEDFFQSTWKHLHEKRTLYAGQPFAPWFFVLIRNLLIDEYRKDGRRKNLFDDYQESLTSKAGAQSEMIDTLNTLPSESGNLIKKYYLEGYSYEDLEKEMGLSQTGLRKRLSRAMLLLKKAFED
jgi:RNA polymerase sigma factor (sigma-70 family)